MLTEFCDKKLTTGLGQHLQNGFATDRSWMQHKLKKPEESKKCNEISTSTGKYSNKLTRL